MSSWSSALTLVLFAVLAGCAPHPLNEDDDLAREALRGTVDQKAPDSVRTPPASGVSAPVSGGAQRQIIQGNQRFIQGPSNKEGRPLPVGKSQGDGSAGVMFNFNNQSIVAVINTIMGDLLQENYSIAQGVSGEVSFSTSNPVDKAESMAILESLLSWTNNAMIRQGDRYLILPASQAVAGQLVPSIGLRQPAAGLSVRLFSLRYISAVEMQKLLKPFARENAFLLVDPARNVLGMAGTTDELANYQASIETFDVDWLRGMSIGVFGLQRATVAELLPELQKVFGPDSGTPLAGMLRFMPIERTNSVVAISSQPQYLQEVGDWIRMIDNGGGNEPQLYVYDVRNMKATDLARYLRQIYGSGAVKEEGVAEVAPGLTTTTLSSPIGGGRSGGGGLGGLTRNPGVGQGGALIQNGSGIQSSAGIQSSGMRQDSSEQNPASTEDETDSGAENEPASDSRKSLDESTRITAQKSSNQLLIRTRPSQWAEIEGAIRRLDNPPMQVQIETRILEVSLTGELDLGVQWYLGQLAGNSTTPGIGNVNGSQGALGSGGAGLGAADTFFYSFVGSNLQVAIRALESTGKTQVLSAPSLVVINNQQAQIQVGDNIPISQTTVNTINSDTTLSSVEYIQTGVILDVVPRINPGGLVYMDIKQQVSDAGATTAAQQNPRISTRSIATQVAVQSGQTVLLGGLIQQDDTQGVSKVPYLGSIPGLGWLFGASTRSKGRTELIVLITPRVVTSNSEARDVTDEYQRQFKLIQPPR
ncbi:type II secretion system secretin GspD [Pseudomonas sp. DSP3-2-2]|uniref:type II secretion system secretin GspD n=1 Tax=unclassified Pseudomonas TaxID=196821 RepID=UPI003CE76568